MRSIIDFITNYLTSIMHFFGTNILDIIILIVLFFYAYEGYLLGFITAFLDLISFILSFIVALKFYASFGLFLGDTFGISPGFARAVGFFLIALLTEIILSLILRKIAKHITKNLTENYNEALKTLNHLLGILPGLASAFIILTFLLSVVISLPSSPYLKSFVTNSRIGRDLVANASLFEKGLNDIFGGALNETMNFITVKPGGSERVDLHFTVQDPTVDIEAEQEMLKLINEERRKNLIPELAMDTKLKELGRDYARDMLQRGYFSHYSLEGLDPFERMNIYKINYTYAGENLALAPSTDLAMKGLMNSPGHRANILNANFTKIGVGVMDGRIYGKMFTQEFTD